MNQTRDSFKTFAAWLVALFLTTLGAQLWIVWLYGSPLPLWDQWYQAGYIFKPWAEGHLTWGDLFGGHGEHRMVVSRLLDLSFIQLNGRWEPLLQMAVNAFLHGALACLFAFCVWDSLGRKNGWLVCFLLLPFFALPYGGENAIWGINSLYYFVTFFALLTIWGLGFGKAGSWPWWLGCVAAVLGLFTMASGLLAPLAAGALVILRAIKNRHFEKATFISLGACLLVVIVGALLSLKADYNTSFQAQTFTQLTGALTRNLTWPFYDLPAMPCLIVLPLAFLLVLYLRPDFAQSRAAEFLLALALWSFLQSILIAYGRANYGEDVPSSRYMDLLNAFVIASVFGAIVLAQLWERRVLQNGLLALVFIGIMFFGLARISKIVVVDLLAPTRMHNLVAEERVQRFMATGNQADLFERPTVQPDPAVTLNILRDPAMQTILPPICLPPAAPTHERLMGPAQWLMQHSVLILSAGLLLFIGLCGYGLARGALGLAMKNPAGILPLLAGMAALGFVWSIHSVTRQSVEYGLQKQIAHNFEAAGNLKRAAIHEQKAEELKQFAN